MELTAEDEARLEGEAGPGEQLAMRIVVALAGATGAAGLLDVTGAHIDSCLYHGQATLDFAGRLLEGGARVSVPTTLNVSSLDMLHPELHSGYPAAAGAARRLAGMYEAMGCSPTWTCAPYHLEQRPALGEHVAWAESNAIVFANSVLGARTDRYGDLIDICAAVTGRAPAAGLHLDENRWATVLFDVCDLPRGLMDLDQAYPLLGLVVGAGAGSRVPVIDGLPAGVGEDRLRALGAAAASAGSVGMFHAVGCTPEAPSLDAATNGMPPGEVVQVTSEDLRRARATLHTSRSGDLACVCVGTPHYSVGEFGTLVDLIEGRRVHRGVSFYASTSRHVLAELRLRGWDRVLEEAGVTLVVDTCTYVEPGFAGIRGLAMTDSAKWAWYAPANLGVEVVFASIAECVDSAVDGRLLFDDGLWGHG